jgi:hypothetical protein
MVRSGSSSYGTFFWLLFLFPATVSPGAGAALVPPPPALPSAPVVQAVAVSASGVSYAGVMGGVA